MAVSGAANKLQRSGGAKSVVTTNPIEISMALPIQLDVGSPGSWLDKGEKAVAGKKLLLVGLVRSQRSKKLSASFSQSKLGRFSLRLKY